MPPASKKYKLFSAASVADKGSALPCAFFASPEGCRNGDKCKFLHVLPGQAKTSPTGAGASSSSVVSTESESEFQASMFASPSAKQEQKQQQEPQGATDAVKSDRKKKRKNKKRKSSGGAEELKDGANIFAAPKKNAGATPTSSQPDKKKQKVAQEATPGSFAAMAKQPPLASVSQTTTNNRAPPHEKRKTVRGAKTQKQQDNVPNFRTMKLPISAFSLPSTKKEEKEAAQSSGTPQDEEPSDISAPPTKPTLPLPKSTPTGLKWQKAVLNSRSHERYDGYFDFAKYKELDEAIGRGNSSDWVKARPFGSWCMSNPQAIAVDCEMCETQDPLSGVTDPKALCRISIVNAEKPDEVLLDTLVKPAWPVVDHRSWINGIKQEHLEKVEFTLRHAQAFMMALCSEETVVVGHAVHNDLAALKMEHHCNVDSSFLFSVKDAPDATPSLKDLAMAILKQEMPSIHDSVNDAHAALMCLESYVERDGKVDPIERTYAPRNRIYASQLFVHRIPKMCKAEHLSSMFLAHTSIQPSEVGEIEFSGNTGKTLITFSSSRHANLAFDTLDGKEEADKSGRMQKKVFLRNRDYVRVRKMAFEKPKQQQPKV